MSDEDDELACPNCSDGVMRQDQLTPEFWYCSSCGYEEDRS
jgi:ribosomal protein S27AE